VGVQDALFYEDFRGSVRHLVGALGGPKKVGGILRPTLSAQAAANWVNDCLSETRDSKFDFEDIAVLLAEGRKLGIHCAMWQLCQESGYAPATIAPIKTPEQVMAARMQELVREFQNLADEAAAMRDNTIAKLKSVS
jgi:hypothetical protein